MRRLNGISRWSERDLITRRNRNSSHTKQLRMPWLPKSRRDDFNRRSSSSIARLPYSNKVTRLPLRSYFTSDWERRAAPIIIDAKSSSDTQKNIKTPTLHPKATFTLRTDPVFFPLPQTYTPYRPASTGTTGHEQERQHRRTKKPIWARHHPSSPVSYESCGPRECARSRSAGKPGLQRGFGAVFRRGDAAERV